MKFKVRTKEREEIEVSRFVVEAANTQSFVAKAVTVVSLALLFAAGIFSMVTNDSAGLRIVVGIATNLLSAVIGYLLGKK